MSTPLLELKDLHVHYPVKQGVLQRKSGAVKAVNGVNLTVNQGHTLGIVGESGCGKSSLARAIVGLEELTSGDILYEGQSIADFKPKQIHALRKEIQMIFQDPFSSLNPRMTVGEIIAAPLKAYKVKGNIASQVKELMELVGLKPDEHYTRLPHEFSGGQRQRIGIARAVALKPKLIVCDEPVSALDVSIQAHVINLLKDLQAEFQLSYLFISHDLSVMKHIADDIAVMYLGKVMETADNDTFYTAAKHPYSKALLSAVTLPDPEEEKQRQQIVLQGELPSAIHSPQGCVFHTRCPIATSRCKQQAPTLETVENLHQSVACFYPGNVKLATKKSG